MNNKGHRQKRINAKTIKEARLLAPSWALRFGRTEGGFVLAFESEEDFYLWKYGFAIPDPMP